MKHSVFLLHVFGKSATFLNLTVVALERRDPVVSSSTVSLFTRTRHSKGTSSVGCVCLTIVANCIFLQSIWLELTTVLVVGAPRLLSLCY